VGFGSLALATALNAAPLSVAIPVVVAAAFLLLRLSENSKIKGDAAVALISTSSLAIGVIIISQTTGMNTVVCNYLFGSILAMAKTDVYLSIALSIIVLVLFILFYHKLFLITFDETFAKAAGIKTGLYNMLIAFLTALTIVLGMRIMGAMLISSLIIFPALSSMRLFKKFKSVTICSAVISILCFFIGIVISYIYATPTGASVVLINIIVFALFWLIENLRNSGGRIMHKTAVVMLAIAASLFVIGCTNKGTNKGTVEISEKMFLAQVNDVYLNAKDYLGRTIKLEGIFLSEQYSDDTEPYCFVIRYGPGCCGTDSNPGFEVKWDKSRLQPYPATESWVKAIGTLKMDKVGDTQYLYLDLSSLDVLSERGAEIVFQ
jgi:zinc transport system permease protein